MARRAPWRDEAARGERADEGRCFPVAMRDADPQALTAPATPVPARHVRRGPCLVVQTSRSGSRSSCSSKPLLALGQDVRTILFARVRGLFLRVILWRLRKRRTVPSHEDQTSFGQLTAQFLQRDVRRLVQHGQDRRACASIGQTAGHAHAFGFASPCSRSSLRQRLTLAAPTRTARLPRDATSHQRQQRGHEPKIDGKRFRLACRPPSGRQSESDQN